MNKTIFGGKDDVGDAIKALENKGGDLDKSTICLRFDGKAFHTFCKGLPRPFDKRLSMLMVDTAKYMVKLTNATVGYTQSDEISLIIKPDRLGNLPFNGRRDKLTSIYASYCSVYFNLNMVKYMPEKFVLPDEDEPAVFDCRAFNVPEPYDSLAIKWRQDDCSRNSVNMLARCYYAHDEIHGQSTYELKQRMMVERGVDWRDQPEFFKYGSLIRAMDKQQKFTYEELRELPIKHQAHSNPDLTVTRRYIDVSHENLHLVTNLSGFLLNHEQPKFRYTCAI